MTSQPMALCSPEAPLAEPTSENRYRALIDASLGIVWRSAPDTSVIQAWGWDTVTGQTVLDYSGVGWLDAVHPEDKPTLLATLEQARTLRRPVEGLYRARQESGLYRWVRARMVPLLGPTGDVQEWVGNLVDVHDRTQGDIALRRGEERLRLALESSSLGVWDFDFVTQSGWWSEAKREVLGLPENYPITEQSFLDLVHEADRADVKAKIDHAMSPASGGRFEAEYRVRRAVDRAELWLASLGQVTFDESGVPLRILGTMRDVTEERRARDELFRLAHFDQLTGLPNRVHFAERVEQALRECPEGAAILLDLDGFKDVNDTAGHHVGDLLLRTVAKRLTSALPSSCVIARWGGDEFCIFLRGATGATEAGIEEVTGLIQQIFAEPVKLPGREVFLSASLGVAVVPARGNTVDDLVGNADLALYEAKKEGRSVKRIFRPELRQVVETRYHLEAELRQAFTNSEFVLFYQPQIDMRNGRVAGAEALIRWKHPERGILTPGAFLTVLKSSPIATSVGNWVLAEACTTAAKMLSRGRPTRIGVNLMSAQFRTGNLVETVSKALRENALPPELLELEITENIVLNGDARCLQTLRELRQMGVGLAFDDYGTGYASLSMLTEYPLTRLKIDQSFIQQMEACPGNRAIVEAVISLARGFGLSVTAEGIETSVQAEAVMALGCDEGQGYLFGRPDTLDRLVERESQLPLYG